jgi:uncharacterized protein (DUF924 family)
MISPNAERVLAFWLGDGTEARNGLWFAGGASLDAAIRELFAEDVRRAAAGDYMHWMESARGSLALIILLDQFTRNVHRNLAASWWLDPLAQRIAAAAVDRGQDRELTVYERLFCYLPLEHAEDRDLQARSIACFERLVADAPAEHADAAAYYLVYAQKHQAVVDRFGRFPHRNAPLGRESTPEELSFIAEHGTGF